MTSEELKQTTERFFDIVVGKPISKDLPEHLIAGFSVKEIEGSYHIFVTADNKNHIIRNVEKPLEDWLEENEEEDQY
jgi:hypothetical protein